VPSAAPGALPHCLVAVPPPCLRLFLGCLLLARCAQQESPFSKFVDGLSPIGPSRTVGASLGQVMPGHAAQEDAPEDDAAAAAVAAASSSFANLSPSRCTLSLPGLHFRSPPALQSAPLNATEGELPPTPIHSHTDPRVGVPAGGLWRPQPYYLPDRYSACFRGLPPCEESSVGVSLHPERLAVFLLWCAAPQENPWRALAVPVPGDWPSRTGATRPSVWVSPLARPEHHSAQPLVHRAFPGPDSSSARTAELLSGVEPAGGLRHSGEGKSWMASLAPVRQGGGRPFCAPGAGGGAPGTAVWGSQRKRRWQRGSCWASDLRGAGRGGWSMLGRSPLGLAGAGAGVPAADRRTRPVLPGLSRGRTFR